MDSASFKTSTLSRVFTFALCIFTIGCVRESAAGSSRDAGSQTGPKLGRIVRIENTKAGLRMCGPDWFCVRACGAIDKVLPCAASQVCLDNWTLRAEPTRLASVPGCYAECQDNCEDARLRCTQLRVYDLGQESGAPRDVKVCVPSPS